MKGVLLGFVFVSALGSVSTSLADVAPPPFAWPRSDAPHGVKAWFGAAASAMKSKLTDAAEKLCDPRGYADNLVGASGSSLKELFARSADQGTHLVGDYAKTWLLIRDQGAIVRATLRENAGVRDVRELYVLLLADRTIDGVVTWRALGAGDSYDEVLKLARRVADRVVGPADRLD